MCWNGHRQEGRKKEREKERERERKKDNIESANRFRQRERVGIHTVRDRQTD